MRHDHRRGVACGEGVVERVVEKSFAVLDPPDLHLCFELLIALLDHWPGSRLTGILWVDQKFLAACSEAICRSSGTSWTRSSSPPALCSRCEISGSFVPTSTHITRPPSANFASA